MTFLEVIESDGPRYRRVRLGRDPRDGYEWGRGWARWHIHDTKSGRVTPTPWSGLWASDLRSWVKGLNSGTYHYHDFHWTLTWEERVALRKKQKRERRRRMWRFVLSSVWRPWRFIPPLRAHAIQVWRVLR